MSDLIRRQDAIDKIAHLDMQVYEGSTCVGTRTCLTKEEIIYAINDLPSAEPERKWIPMTERLPEKHQRVLVTIKRTGGEMRVRSGNYFDDYFWIDNGDCWKCNEVLAWMPLPEPWRGE